MRVAGEKDELNAKTPADFPAGVPQMPHEA
jgi:hypothetical protein